MTKAFLLGVNELEKMLGAETVVEWLESIGSKSAEWEGPGIDGEDYNDLNCIHVCPFLGKLNEFVEAYGKLPSSHKRIIDFANKKYAGSEGPIISNVCCILHYAHWKKRAELAGKKEVLHLANKSPITAEELISQEAIKKSKHKPEEIKTLFKNNTCIIKYV